MEDAMRGWMLLLGALCCGAAGAAPLNPCLLTPAELAPVLGHEPQPGRAERDPLGTPMCIYETRGEIGKRFLLLVHPSGWDKKRYANRLSLAEGSGIRTAHKFAGIGEAAFYVDGVGGALQGPRYVELSGFKQAARRPVQAEEAGALLSLALSRLPGA
jgi:hypothetical protein